MRLKRLELFGFKSFADRTVLDFGDRLNGIVGPNGCGKSNVVDAVRWVLGETRPTSMRGEDMADVIFKGSTSRPPLSVAEVTMVLDNQSGALEDRGEEVSVTRRVFKAGEGEYLIDGIQVRRKDVREMLFDTGLGSRGYSVLEQGRIDAVLSANAIDRRSIFEEAAGISRYRQRKKEAESRLNRVQQDLVRLEDVVGELEKRSRSLKLQAGKARRYVEARDAWKVEGLRLAQHQAHALAEELRALAAELAEHGEREAVLRAERDDAEGVVAAREREQEALSAEVERLAAEASELAGDVRALDERVAQLATRVCAWDAAAVAEAERAVELENRLAERRTERGEVADELERLHVEEEDARAALAREEESARELSRRYQEARRGAEQRSERVLELLHERTSAKNALEHHGQTLGGLAERHDRARSRAEEAGRTLSGARAVEAEAVAAAERAEAALRTGEAHREAFEREANELEREVTHLDAERGKLELERTRLASRVDALLDRERELEGLGAGARAVVESAQADGVEPPATDMDAGEAGGLALAGELRGLVADHLRTGSRTARALDGVLGTRAQALVLSDRGDAERILAWLKGERAGQVALALPQMVAAADAAGPDAPGAARSVPPEVLAGEGVLGRLRDAVEPAEGYAALADALLDGVVLVRDVATALALAGANPLLRFVTEDGDVVDAGGVTGGHREAAHGPIGRRAHAADLEAEVARADEGIERLSAALAAVAERRDTKRRGLDELLEELQQERQALARAKSEVDGARTRVADLEEAARLFRREEHTIAEERTRLEAAVEEARTRLAAAEASFAEENARLEEAEGLRRELEARREEYARAESQAKVQATRLAEQKAALVRRARDLDAGLAELGRELERANGLVDENRAAAAQGRRESDAHGDERVELLERRGAVEERLEALRASERAGRGAIEELRRRREVVTRELEGLMTTVGQRRLAEQKRSLAREELLRRAEEDFGLAPLDLLEGFAPDEELAGADALAALVERVRELRAELERLGPVNLDAVGELEEVTERLDFLTGQRDDLQSARRNLESTIKTINLESERLFLEAFHEIRGHFQTIFRQLFGGGRADVELQPDASVLEAGIEITARPPGRETLPISLLSGGQRTMTALALLFAVFRSRPSPFCVLDEVDAALDDANIARFLGLIDSFRRDTQFVVVTHNKGTMAACDRLYGVTMAVRGVSNVVSVELHEVDEFVPEATGSAAAGSAPPVRADEDGDERVVELVPHRSGSEAPQA
jgi:chromosome segregation protein